MTDVHFFPRYQGPENFHTNNTLLLFNLFAKRNAALFQAFLLALFEIEPEDAGLHVGPRIRQQTSGPRSIPDGSIQQSSFKIVIETKRDRGKLDLDQLCRHVHTFRDEEAQLLVFLAPSALEPERVAEARAVLANESAKHRPGSRTPLFVSTTFSRIVQAARDVLPPYEFDLAEKVNDYEAYCAEQRLLDDEASTMRIVACNVSAEVNRLTGLYFDPADRPFRPYRFIGFYGQKRVWAVGRLSKIVAADMRDGRLDCRVRFSSDGNDVTDSERNRIVEAMRLTDGLYDIASNHKFHLCTDFVDTHFEKRTKGGLMSYAYLDLRPYVLAQPVPNDGATLARLLKGQAFE